jgi:hypothetical protein
MLIAMVIFLSKPLERTRLEFDEQITALTSEQQAREAEIRSFDYIASNTEAVLGDVNQKINDRLAWLDTEKTTECACAYVGGFSCGETLPSPMRPSGGGQPDQVMVRRYRAMQQCVKLEDLLKNAENDRRLEARGLAETTRLIDLLKREQELPGPLPIDNMPVPLPQIMELMEHARQDGKAWRDNKVQQQEGLKQEQNTWVDKRRKLGDTGRSGLALWAGRIVEFYWPYILISFLGMKVARVNYIQKLRDR